MVRICKMHLFRNKVLGFGAQGLGLKDFVPTAQAIRTSVRSFGFENSVGFSGISSIQITMEPHNMDPCTSSRYFLNTLPQANMEATIFLRRPQSLFKRPAWESLKLICTCFYNGPF